MAKITLSDVSSGYVSTAALNDNFDAIETALENTLSRDGTGPNSLGADLDFNSNRAINLSDAIGLTEAVTLGQLSTLLSGSDLTGVVPITWELVANGTDTYSIPLASHNAVTMYIVSVDKLIYPPSSYSIDPTTQTITFLLDVPTAGQLIVVRLYGKISEIVYDGIYINNAKETFRFSIAGTETTFLTTIVLDANATDVYLNGSKLILSSDYTLSDKSIVLTSSAFPGDILEVVVCNSLVAPTTSLLTMQGYATAASNSADAASTSEDNAAASAALAAVAGGAAGAIAGAIGLNWIIVNTTPHNAVTLEAIFVDTSSGAITVNLPTTPSIGDQIYFSDVSSTFATNSLIIGRSGENIMGFASDMTVSTNNAAFIMTYSDATNGWRIG